MNYFPADYWMARAQRAEAERDALHALLAVYVHAFDSDNAVPPHIVAQARAILASSVTTP